jgi:hypothetical protein
LSQRNIGLTEAAESPGSHGFKGLWLGNIPTGLTEASSWQAHWIWVGDEWETDTLLARRSFNFSELPANAILRITATSQYELYLNNLYISRGPARCAPHHQSFDAFDVTDLLVKGENVLAVRVHYQEGHVSYHHEGRAGLLAQLDFPGAERLHSVLTDSSWKVHPDTAWDKRAPRMSRFHLEVCDRVDFRKQIRGWQEVSFDDSQWPAAVSLTRNVGWPTPQENDRPGTLVPPWTSLVPRDIPFLQERIIEAVELDGACLIAESEIEAVSLPVSIVDRINSGFEEYKAGNGPLVIPASDPSQIWFLLFDFGSVLNGRPRLEIEGAAGTQVEIHSAPFVVNNRFTANVVDSRFVDHIVLSGDRDQWESTYFKPVRFLGITIRGEGAVTRLHEAGIRQVEYPFEEKGSLRTPEDPWLERFWQAAAKTIRVCTTDAYTDNYRERRQYSQTAYYASLGNYWTFGDTLLQRRYLKQIAEEQQANGLLPAYAPRHGDDFMVILDSNCFWIRGLRNYLLYSGDEETALELLPAARKQLRLLHGFTNSLGLIDHPPYAYWLDHALNDRRGANFCLNGHYLGALEDFSEVLNWLGQAEQEVYRTRADQLRRSLRENFWDSRRKLFSDSLIDGELSDMFSEHANAMALALNVATEEQAKAIALQLLSRDNHDYIRRESGITMVTPAMSYFLHKGLCEQGHISESLAMFRNRFEKMLQTGTNQTLWEEWWLTGTGRTGTFVSGRTRSDAQTESAFPPALFGEYILGIRPVKPGLKEVNLYLPNSGLKSVSGALPTPMGNLQVEWNLAESRGDFRTLSVTIPEGMMVKLDLSSLLPSIEGRSIWINDKAVDISNLKDFFLLKQGQHSVSF